MLLNLNGSSTNGFFELMGILIVFLLVLGVAYYITRWIGASTAIQDKNRNIKVIETYRISSNKFIQILKIGNKCIAIAISKEEVEFLTELDEEYLEVREQDVKPLPDFKEILTKVTKTCKTNKEKKGKG